MGCRTFHKPRRLSDCRKCRQCRIEYSIAPPVVEAALAWAEVEELVEQLALRQGRVQRPLVEVRLSLQPLSSLAQPALAVSPVQELKQKLLHCPMVCCLG